jgi:hypothetical protein
MFKFTGWLGIAGPCGSLAAKAASDGIGLIGRNGNVCHAEHKYARGAICLRRNPCVIRRNWLGARQELRQQLRQDYASFIMVTKSSSLCLIMARRTVVISGGACVFLFTPSTLVMSHSS